MFIQSRRYKSVILKYSHWMLCQYVCYEISHTYRLKIATQGGKVHRTEHTKSLGNRIKACIMPIKYLKK